MRTIRRGVTMIEVTVVVALLATIGLLFLVAITSARRAAVCTQSKNYLRQIVLAVHGYASANNRFLPTNYGNSNMTSGVSFYLSLAPYIGEDGDLPYAVMISPADPTGAIAQRDYDGATSYGANALIFTGQNPRTLESISDGTSATVALVEHYAKCGNVAFVDFPWYFSAVGPVRRATFADLGDAQPVTSGEPPVSVSSNTENPNLTFQPAPRVSDCKSDFAQTPHPDGMLVAFLDGSVRQLSPGIAPHVYWALITPAGSEAVEVPD